MAQPMILSANSATKTWFCEMSAAMPAETSGKSGRVDFTGA